MSARWAPSARQTAKPRSICHERGFRLNGPSPVPTQNANPIELMTEIDDRAIACGDLAIFRFGKPPKEGEHKRGVSQDDNCADRARDGDHVCDPNCFEMSGTFAQHV